MALDTGKLLCPRCGNALFHCGLSGYPHWCGACDWRGPATKAVKA